MKQNKKPPYCHSRVGGNPDLNLSEMFRDYRNLKSLDSRLHGNDGAGIAYFNLLYRQISDDLSVYSGRVIF
ncbi:hypothetical protein CYK00_06225 [Neisseria sicca]|uniref:Uncharacterized protein n=2 Tax=Neisseria TaxID=482 RepID=A0A1V0HDK4_NEISI|nr:hypothetical protein A6J88_05620 [Neisseria mucosa]AVR78003.1 hypothetical protein NM96_00175 [Neisseria mucosa]PLA40281.1 hypothetical protein CYK00_06225 [Neisseria sicca]